MLYAILRSEDNAPLMGSLLLFALLAAITIGTRKVDRYSLGAPPGMRDRPEAGRDNETETNKQGHQGPKRRQRATRTSARTMQLETAQR